jgi:hypothetical protein
LCTTSPKYLAPFIDASPFRTGQVIGARWSEFNLAETRSSSHSCYWTDTSGAMSDLHVLDTSPAGMKAVQAAYMRKCTLILERVFHRSYDVRQPMLVWLTERFQKSADPASLLHDDPLTWSGDIWGFPPSMSLQKSWSERPNLRVMRVGIEYPD